MDRADPITGVTRNEVYGWNGHGHFDETEYGIEAKLALLRGEKTEMKNTIREGHASAKMCLATREFTKTGKVIISTFTEYRVFFRG